MKILLIAALFLLPVTSTFAAAPSPQTHTHTVIYEVPAPENLQPFSRFAMSYESRKLDNGLLELRYTLPDTLVGKPREFRFVGKDDPYSPSFSLTAVDGKMSCVAQAENASCQVVHHEVVIDLPEVKAALDRTNLSPREKEGRLQLAAFVARAGGDIIGVMTYIHGIGGRKRERY